MFKLSISVDSFALLTMFCNILLAVILFGSWYYKRKNNAKSLQRVTEIISNYFASTGADVQVSCFKVKGSNHFTAAIESQPLKMFRYSNVLESYLIAHVFKATGNRLDKIYWRFPVQKPHATGGLHEENAHAKAAMAEDVYFSDVESTAKALAEYKVSEVSWDEFMDAKKQ